MLVVLTGGISSALLLSSLTNTGKVIILTVYFVLLILVICAFIVTTIKEELTKQRKEVLETFVKSLDYTRDNIEVLKDLNRVICDIQNLSIDTREFVQRNNEMLLSFNKIVSNTQIDLLEVKRKVIGEKEGFKVRNE